MGLTAEIDVLHGLRWADNVNKQSSLFRVESGPV